MAAYRSKGALALDALGDPSRRAIFERLAQRPQAVGALAASLPISRPAVSQHLKLLKGSGLVTDDAVGTRRVYRVVPDAVVALREYLDLMWDRALASYAAAVDEPEGTDDDRSR